MKTYPKSVDIKGKPVNHDIKTQGFNEDQIRQIGDLYTGGYESIQKAQIELIDSLNLKNFSDQPEEIKELFESAVNFVQSYFKGLNIDVGNMLDNIHEKIFTSKKLQVAGGSNDTSIVFNDDYISSYMGGHDMDYKKGILFSIIAHEIYHFLYLKRDYITRTKKNEKGKWINSGEDIWSIVTQNRGLTRNKRGYENKENSDCRNKKGSILEEGMAQNISTLAQIEYFKENNIDLTKWYLYKIQNKDTIFEKHIINGKEIELPLAYPKSYNIVKSLSLKDNNFFEKVENSRMLGQHIELFRLLQKNKIEGIENRYDGLVVEADKFESQ